MSNVLAAVFAREEWEWSTVGGVPTADHIRDTILRLFESCRKGYAETGDDYSVATGRLCVRTVYYGVESDPSFELSLELGEL